MKRTKKLVAMVAVALTLCMAIGGTLAYLTDTTEQVVNTFTVGKVDIDLGETTGNSYKMIPGGTIEKDPKVTVKAGSEACYVFVKVEKSNNFDTFMSYKIADGWTALADADGVYYRIVNTLVEATEDATYPVLSNNQVTVKAEITSEQMDALNNGTYPTLTFTAYAIQKANLSPDTAANAWTLLNPTATD